MTTDFMIACPLDHLRGHTISISWGIPVPLLTIYNPIHKDMSPQGLTHNSKSSDDFGTSSISSQDWESM